MTRAIALFSVGVGMLACDWIGGAGLSSAPALARDSVRSPMARTAQEEYYPLPTPTPIRPTPVTPLPVMTPFPIVRIVGQTTSVGARIRILSVRAPANTTIAVRCRKRGCRRISRHRGRGIRRAVRFRRFERRLRAGTIIEVLVGRVGVIGKYTRFGIRRNRAPSRRDLCLRPGATQGSPCPED